MSAFQIKDIINNNNVNVFSSNFTLYGDMSNRVMSIYAVECNAIEIYSIDEAFINMSGVANLEEKAVAIRNKVRRWTGIPVSIGIAKTKTLAKIANHIAKKYKNNGVFFVRWRCTN